MTSFPRRAPGGAHVRLCIACILLLGLTAPAAAQQRQAQVPSTAERMTGAAESSAWDGFEGNIGGGVILRPEYEGGSDFEAAPLPWVDVTWRNRVFLHTENGLGLNLRRTRNVQVAATLNVDLGRQEDDSDDLRGLGDIDESLEVGGLFELVNGHWRVHGSAALGVTDGHEGVIADLGFKYGARYGQRSVVTLGPTMTVASDQYMQSYFGVDAQQSARSGLPQHEATLGIKDFTLEGQFTHYVTPNWAVSAKGEAVMLFGDAADSPIVQEDMYFTAALVLTYGF
ncbi:MAG: MipA/OmpV family protein [Acetobacterales bacterium]